MSDERLRELYTAAVAGRPAGAEPHPAPEAIAALARREGPEEARLATLDHVMGCDDCRREFDLLRTLERAGAQSGVAARPAGRRAWFMPAALAASLLLAVGIGRQVLRSGSDDTTRGDGESGAIVLVQPGAEMPAGQSLTFAWRPVSGASRYELELLDAGGCGCGLGGDQRHVRHARRGAYAAPRRVSLVGPRHHVRRPHASLRPSPAPPDRGVTHLE